FGSSCAAAGPAPRAARNALNIIACRAFTSPPNWWINGGIEPAPAPKSPEETAKLLRRIGKRHEDRQLDGRAGAESALGCGQDRQARAQGHGGSRLPGGAAGAGGEPRRAAFGRLAR